MCIRDRPRDDKNKIFWSNEIEASSSAPIMYAKLMADVKWSYNIIQGKSYPLFWSYFRTFYFDRKKIFEGHPVTISHLFLFHFTTFM